MGICPAAMHIIQGIMGELKNLGYFLNIDAG